MRIKVVTPIKRKQENPQQKNKLVKKTPDLVNKPAKEGTQQPKPSQDKEADVEFPFLQDGEAIPLLHGALSGNEAIDEVLDRNSFYAVTPAYSKNDELNFISQAAEEIERQPAWVKEEEGDPSFMEEIQGGLKQYYNKFASFMNESMGTDMSKYKINRERFKDSAAYDIVGGHALSLGAGLGTAAVVGGAALVGAPLAVPALVGGGIAVGASYLNSFLATYDPRKDLELQQESLVPILQEAFTGKKYHGFIPNDVEKLERMSRGELTHRIFLGDMLDTVILIGTFGLAGKGGRALIRGGTRTVKKVIGGNKPQVVKKAKEIMPVATDEKSIKYTGQALDEGQQILDEQVIDNVAVILGTDRGEAIKYYNKITETLETGDPLKFIDDPNVVKLVNSGMKLGAGAREYALDKGLYKESLDIIQNLKASQTALRERLAKEGKPPPTPLKGGAVEDVSTAHIKRAGSRLDRAFLDDSALRQFKKDGDLQSLDDIIYDVKEATINMPAQIKTDVLPTPTAKKQIAGKPSEKALPAVEADTPTGAEMTGILTRKELLMEKIAEVATKGGDTAYLNKLIELDSSLNNLARVRATKAGGNLKRWQEISDRIPEFNRIIGEMRRVQNDVSRGFVSQAAAKAKVDRFMKKLKQLDTLNYTAEVAKSEVLRLTIDGFLSRGAVFKAAVGNTISPLLQSAGTVGIMHPMKALTYAGQTLAINLRNALRLGFTKQGWKDAAGIYTGVKRTRNRFGLKNHTPETLAGKSWHAFTNIYSGTMDLVDYTTREGLELASARSTLFDMVKRRLREGETHQSIAKDFRQILTGDKVNMEMVVDYNRHVGNTLDQMLFRGKTSLNYDNAAGEGHNVLSLMGAYLAETTQGLSRVTDDLFKNSRGIAKVPAGTISLATDAFTAFTNVGTQSLNYLSDYIPILGARADLGRGFIRNLPKAGKLTRKQLVGSTMVGTTWALNNLYEDHTGNKLIEFRFPKSTEKMGFQRMGGRTGIYVDGHFIDYAHMPVIGDFIRIMNKSMGLLQYGYDSVTDDYELGVMKRVEHVISELADMIAGDTYLTKTFTLGLSDILRRGDLESAGKRTGETVYHLLRPWGRHVDKFEDAVHGRQSRTRSGFEYWGDRWDALKGELYAVEATLSDDVKYDIFGVPYSKGEDRTTTDTLFGKFGVLIRNGLLHAKGPVPKQNEIVDLLVSTGAFEASEDFVVGGRILKKELLPPELRPNFTPPRRSIKLHPALTTGGQIQSKKLNYRLANRRDRLMGMDLKYTQQLIDEYTRFYQSLGTPNKMELTRVNRALNALKKYKGYFKTGTVKAMIPTYKEGYNMIDSLHDVVKTKSDKHAKYVATFARHWRNQAHQKNLHTQFSEKEIKTLADRTARVHLLKLVYQTYNDMISGLLGLDPELYKEAKELGFFEQTQVRGTSR